MRDKPQSAHWSYDGLPYLARRLIQRGTVFDLSHDLAAGMPMHPMHPPFAFTLMQRHGDLYRDHGYSFANELIVLSGHHGTHIDAVGHISKSDRLHDDVNAMSTQQGRDGLKQYGVEELPPVFCRGVLLDVAGFRGLDVLPAGSAISASELRSTAEHQQVRVEPGDTVLIRTGWSRHWSEPGTFVGVNTGQPGPDEGAAIWLAEQGVRMTGSDTMVYEVLRPGQNEMPVHLALIYERAIPILEMLQLDDLAAARAWEFLFVVLPLRIRGATGSPVRPVALV